MSEPKVSEYVFFFRGGESIKVRFVFEDRETIIHLRNVIWYERRIVSA